jgi:3-deoxy-D-manno-octulosonic-acid transferase
VEEEKAIDVFEKLKEMLSNVLILTTPKHVDASNIVGTTFSQLDEKGHDHPIYYASQQLILA